MPRSHLSSILDVLHMHKKIMQLGLVSKLIWNHQNIILTVATYNDDIIMPVATTVTIATANDDVSNARGYCGWLLCYW
jgi:hypothetical protein